VALVSLRLRGAVSFAALAAWLLQTGTHSAPPSLLPHPTPGTLNTIFESAGWDAAKAGSKSKLELTSGNNIYCVEFDDADKTRVLLAVVSSNYPTRYIFSSSAGGSTSPRLMRELKENIEEQLAASSGAPEKVLKRGLKPALKSLASKFDSLETLDVLMATTKKVQDVQRLMAANIATATERDTLLVGLQEKGETLKNSGKKMFESASAARYASRMACIRTYSIAILLFLVIGTGVIVGLNYSTYHWWQ
jgi:hypothetical protein